MDAQAGGLTVLIEISYLVASVLFILGLKRLSSPKTARSGNLLGATGMLLAVVATLSYGGLDWAWILVGVVVGAGIGAFLARWVAMTAMPQMVAVFNAFGGGASVLVASVEFLKPGTAAANFTVALTIVLSVLIGSVTFTGSLLAWAKLQGHFEKALTYPGANVVNGLVFLAILGLGAWVSVVPGAPVPWFVVLAALSLLFGLMFVMPIGGADMPVVVALLNSYSGLAAAATGFVLNNNVLIIAGALVGASGIILTMIMCRAMNRSLPNVLFSAFGSQAQPAAAAGDGTHRIVKEINAEDTAVLMSYSSSVVVVPGYGLAVAQAQHQVRELADTLGEKGVTVKFAIHPVAGRMPGHMNVLLAEAEIPYDQLYESDDINPELERTDVVLIIGANDVVNPDARTRKDSPLYGMPIINADYAKNTIVIKRSMSPGFAGTDNPLFYKDNNKMLFGDAKKVLTSLVSELKKV
ncbi:MAG TPA: NAD(P)(+) transhydrogenase (Re/Si-specific) subunit beta [Vicinamibacterales bacterium]|nr:NAD(P)(+) transhydrogenase (Re/Si-specific) subunit beta [Vicinamibacterales bacterium]